MVSQSSLGYPIVQANLYGAGLTPAALGYNTYSMRYDQPGTGPRFDRFKRGVAKVGRVLAPLAAIGAVGLAARHLAPEEGEFMQLPPRDRPAGIRGRLPQRAQAQADAAQGFASDAAQLNRMMRGRGKKRKPKKRR